MVEQDLGMAVFYGTDERREVGILVDFNIAEQAAD